MFLEYFIISASRDVHTKENGAGGKVDMIFSALSLYYLVSSGIPRTFACGLSTSYLAVLSLRNSGE